MASVCKGIWLEGRGTIASPSTGFVSLIIILWSNYHHHCCKSSNAGSIHHLHSLAFKRNCYSDRMKNEHWKFINYVSVDIVRNGSFVLLCTVNWCTQIEFDGNTSIFTVFGCFLQTILCYLFQSNQALYWQFCLSSVLHYSDLSVVCVGVCVNICSPCSGPCLMHQTWEVIIEFTKCVSFDVFHCVCMFQAVSFLAVTCMSPHCHLLL